MRKIISIANNWLFKKGQETVPNDLPADWMHVDLPYTWNGEDGQDGGNDYFRGTSCFVRTLKNAEMPEGEAYYLQFDGVNSSAAVYCNGQKICTHDGGYSTFRVELTNIREENLLAVLVDNAPNDRVYPQMADFTFYGGIYRDERDDPTAQKRLEAHGAAVRWR